MFTAEPFWVKKGNIHAVPIVHYNMEMASQVKLAFEALQPDCIAVELPETMQSQMLHAASRLPDLSVVLTYNQIKEPLYFLCEPCEATFEALRSGLENQLPVFCIDLDVDFFPDIRDLVPDPYAAYKLGLKTYYEICEQALKESSSPYIQQNMQREVHMARRLKELSLSYDKILFVCGMSHLHSILNLIDKSSFTIFPHAERETIKVCTLSEKASREVLAEFGWLTVKYEESRNQIQKIGLLDRQKCIFQLYKEASENYIESTGNLFPSYHFRNTMKFVRNYALTTEHLMPDLFQILSAAKGCVDHNYAYEVWNLATSYPFLKNIDGLPELDLSVKDIWGHSKFIRFHMKEKRRKNELPFRQRKDRSNIRFKPPGPFTICSFPPEDVAIEKFGNFLKKKGTQILTDEAARTIPFSTSLEDGIDTKETIRHWFEKKLYVKVKGKPPGGVGSVCIIFDDDSPKEGQIFIEKFPWCTTWIGEHEQESDMALYATSYTKNVVGPGISRCEYGGFMMSYPPRRMHDVWSDPDYQSCRSKPEVLLMAAIDYAVKPIIVYVASSPPKTFLKSFAKRYGKKIVFIPIGQLSPITINKLRAFHVLDGHDKRKIADEYIF